MDAETGDRGDDSIGQVAEEEGRRAGRSVILLDYYNLQQGGSRVRRHSRNSRRHLTLRKSQHSKSTMFPTTQVYKEHSDTMFR